MFARRVIRGGILRASVARFSALVPSPSCVIDSVGSQLINVKQHLGSQVMIVSGNDDRSMQLRQHMWAELQKVGIQAVFSTALGQYPTADSLKELATMVKRSGAKSIVAVGDRSAIRSATAMRQGIALKHTFDESLTTLKDMTEDQTRAMMPLIYVPTDAPSPTMYYNHVLGISNKATDVLSWVVTKPAELVIHDLNWGAPMSVSDLKVATVSTIGELLDTVHAALYASSEYTRELKSALPRPTNQQQQWGQPAAVELREEDNWEAAMQSIVSQEVERLQISSFIDFSTDDKKVLWTNLCQLSKRVAEMRAKMEDLCEFLEFPMCWATPIEMRSSYDALRLLNIEESACTISARNTIKLLKFAMDERSRLTNKRPDNTELTPHHALLKSICVLLPILNTEKKNRYSFLNANMKEHQGALVKDDGLYTDVANVIAQLEPLLKPIAKSTSDAGVPSYDELRLAEVIHMEDQVYSLNQINRSVFSNGRVDITNIRDDENGDNPNKYARIEFLKSDLFYDYCHHND